MGGKSVATHPQSPHSGNRLNIPKLTYTPSKGTLGIFVIASSNGCPAIATLLSLDASLAIPTRVLHLEASGRCRRTPVRPIRPTGQTDLMLLLFGLWSWLCGSTNEPRGFLVNHWKPSELGVTSANHHS
jgi:hypothetical protein